MLQVYRNGSAYQAISKKEIIKTNFMEHIPSSEIDGRSASQEILHLL
jgi:hypothetical protein